MTNIEEVTAAKVEEFDLIVLGSGEFQISCLDTCEAGSARRCGGASVDWRLLPKHCVPAKQKPYTQCEGCFVLCARSGVWH